MHLGPQHYYHTNTWAPTNDYFVLILCRYIASQESKHQAYECLKLLNISMEFFCDGLVCPCACPQACLPVNKISQNVLYNRPTSVSVEVRCDAIIGLEIYGFLWMVNSNVRPNSAS